MAGALTHRLGLLSSAAAVQRGALAYNTASQAVASAGILFDSESYDVTGWHSTGSNTDQFVVPSGVSYVRFLGEYRSSSNTPGCFQSLNGSNFHGMGWSHSSTAGADAIGVCSAIIAVSPGDVFRALTTGVTGDDVDANCWAAIEAVTLPRTALVRKSADQALSANTTTVLTWDTEVRDTDSFHDNVTDNSRLVAPTTGLYRASCNLKWANASFSASDQFVLSMVKNGSSAPGLPSCDLELQSSGFVTALNGVSAILALTAGDYIEARAVITSAQSIAADQATWFQLEEIPAGTKYCLVNKAATQSLSAGTNTVITFGAGSEVADTDGFHDTSSNTSRLTIPAGLGITQARLSFNLTSASVTGQFIGFVTKNGASDNGLPRSETDTVGSDNVNGFGAWVDVVAGDYFELNGFATSAQTLPISNTTWFCIETR